MARGCFEMVILPILRLEEGFTFAKAVSLISNRLTPTTYTSFLFRYSYTNTALQYHDLENQDAIPVFLRSSIYIDRLFHPP